MHDLALITCLLFTGAAMAADAVFSDSFDTGPAADWGNEFGDWNVINGAYRAGISNNFPNSHSALPFALTDMAIEVDINDVTDGGVWIRCESDASPIGVRGVLLVTKGTGVYWHVVDNGTYGPILGQVNGLFGPGSDIHLRVEATGTTYSAFVNGSTTPDSTIESNAFEIGRVALYGFSDQTFDNVELVDLLGCVTDINDDCFVDVADLLTLLAEWGRCDRCASDIDESGTVDVGDLLMLLAAWGPCA